MYSLVAILEVRTWVEQNISIFQPQMEYIDWIMLG
jgi:hypothetical protein